MPDPPLIPPHQFVIIVVGAHYRPFSLKQHPFLGATCVHVSHCPSGAAVRRISSACVHSSSQRLQFIDWMILKKCLCRSVGLLSSKRITKFNINMYHLCGGEEKNRNNKWIIQTYCRYLFTYTVRNFSTYFRHFKQISGTLEMKCWDYPCSMWQIQVNGTMKKQY